MRFGAFFRGGGEVLGSRRRIWGRLQRLEEDLGGGGWNFGANRSDFGALWWELKFFTQEGNFWGRFLAFRGVFRAEFWGQIERFRVGRI